jgi:hypothetical protein
VAKKADFGPVASLTVTPTNAALFVMTFVPETKGRSLEAIEQFRHRKPAKAGK